MRHPIGHELVNLQQIWPWRPGYRKRLTPPAGLEQRLVPAPRSGQAGQDDAEDPRESCGIPATEAK